MLYFAAVWVFLLLTCIVIGLATLHRLQVKCFVQMGDRMILAAWLGVVEFAIALLITSWIAPLSLTLGILLGGALCTLALTERQTRSEAFKLWRLLYPKYSPSLIAILIGVATVMMLRPVTWIDTGYYHAQTIQWLERFGAVPGLALLSDHLGFTSSWFAFAAPFNASFLEGKALAVSNGFVLLLVVLQICVSLRQLYGDRAALKDWFLLYYSGILLLIMLRFQAILAEIFRSPSPDIPVLWITGIIAWAMMTIAHSEQRSSTYDRLIPLILASGAFTIKLVALPLLFVTGLFYLMHKPLRRSSILMGLIVAIAVLSPVLIHGVVISGCPVYPSTAFCLDLPWTPDRQAVEKIAKVTHEWTTQSQAASAANFVDRVAQIWTWFRAYVGNPKIVLALMIASIASAICLLRNPRQAPGCQWLILMAIVGIGFLLKTSPMIRFWLSYLSLLPILLLALFCHLQSGEKSPQWIQHTGTALLKIPRSAIVLPLFLSTFILLSNSQSVLSKVVFPPARPEISVSSITVNGIRVSVANSKVHCWATPIPCTPKRPNDLYLRDPVRGIAAGFVRSRTP